MMTEKEFEQTGLRIAEQKGHPVIIEAGRIVTEYFTSPESLGSLRLRSHVLWDNNMALGEFLAALHDFFG